MDSFPFALGFSFIDDELHCGAIPVSRIANEVGTPVFVYNIDAIVRRYRSYASAFDGMNHRTCYAVKANSTRCVLSALNDAGCGFDVNSRGELFRALKAGAEPASITMTGVGKTDADVVDGLEAGITAFNAESFEECARIDRLAAQRGLRARVILRINPDVDAHTHPYIATGLASHKFGLTEESVREALPNLLALRNIELVGFGMHLGSQIFDVSPYVQGVEKILSFIRSIASMLPRPISIINIGGGLGVAYDEHERDADPAALARALRPLLSASIEGLASDFALLSEPGRFLVANAGVLISRVEYIKRTSSRTFLILDAGMNDLIRPALYEAYHEMRPVNLRNSGSVPYDVVGPVCESGDTFATQRSMAEVSEGDFVAIFSAGAYSATMSSNYNSRPLAAEVAVQNGQWFIARKRQTLEQMIQNEA